MYKKLKGFVLCGFVVLALTVSSAYADINTGWYYGLGAGGALLTDGDYTTAAANTGDFEHDIGFLVSGAVGYKFGMPRLEAEILYQCNDYDKQNATGSASADVSGEISSLAFMVNGYLDFANESSFTPFIIVGAGVANVEIDDLRSSAGASLADDDDTVFAYQVGAGVAIDISDNFILDFKYCYFGTSDQDFPDINNGSGTIENEFASHNMTIGFRYSF
jgi:opacity protein-like surface antigen